MKALQPLREKERLDNLHSLQILDTPSEKEYDELVELASKICHVPIALISLIDEKRQWFKARIGLEVNETDRDFSFCAHAILKNNLFIVEDASNDPRFFDNPLVTNFPNMRFYAGAQLVSENGYKLGTLCVIDDKPRNLSWEQISALRVIANAVEKLLMSRMHEKQTHTLNDTICLQAQQIDSVSHQHNQLMEAVNNKMSGSITNIQNELKILKSGKFTKKDIASVSKNAETEMDALTSFLGFIKTYSLFSDANNLPDKNLLIKNAVTEIFSNHEEKMKARHIAYTVEIEDDLKINNNRVQVLFALQHLLQLIITSSLKNKINVFAKSRKRNIEISISITNFNDAEIFTNYFEDISDKNSSAKPLTEFDLINNIIKTNEGEIKIIETDKLHLLITVVLKN